MATAQQKAPKKPYPTFLFLPPTQSADWQKTSKENCGISAVEQVPITQCGSISMIPMRFKPVEIRVERESSRYTSDTMSAYDARNFILERQQLCADSGEVTRRNFSDHLKACQWFMGHLGKFTMAASLRRWRLLNVQVDVPGHLESRTNSQ